MMIFRQTRRQYHSSHAITMYENGICQAASPLIQAVALLTFFAPFVRRERIDSSLTCRLLDKSEIREVYSDEIPRNRLCAILIGRDRTRKRRKTEN